MAKMRKVRFRSLKPGDVFRRADMGDYFQKINLLEDKEQGLAFNCLNILKSTLAYVPDKEIVYKHLGGSLELKVEEKN